MNAIRPLNAFAQAVTPLPDPLGARRAVVERRLAELQGTWLRRGGVELRILPQATPEERIAMATILLADTGMRIVKED
jgi:hypothetical protein